MMFSKQLFILPLLAATLTSCTSEKSPYWGKEVAEFKVSAPTAEPLGSNGEDSFGFKNKANMSFNACLSDLSGGPLPSGLDFAVKVGSQEEIPVKTDVKSCIKWEREIGYTELKSEKYYLLKTKFISRNKLKGEITLDLLLNPLSSSVTDMRDISASKKRDIEEVQGDTVNIQDITSGNGSQITLPGQQGSIIPGTNVITGTAVTTDYTVVINAVTLEKIRLDMDKPYTVDEHLNLTTHNTFLVSVSPQFIVRRFNNQFEKLAPSRGQFKISLAFLAEPDFRIDDLWKRLESLKLFGDVKQLMGTSKNRKEAFDLNITRFLKEKEQELNYEMTVEDKRLVLARLMLPFVHQTVQTTAEMTPQFGLQQEVTVGLDQMALFPRRAMIAVTVEPIGPEIKKQMKADGAGYVTSLYSPSGVTQFAPYKIEADLIHSQKQNFTDANKPKKPLEMFSGIPVAQSRVYPMSLGDVSFQHNRIAPAIKYDLTQMMGNFYAGKLSGFEKNQFLKALCHKVYTHDSLQSADHDVLQAMRKGCERSPDLILEISQLDFIDSLVEDKVNLVGPVVGNAISISQSFSRATGSSRDQGSTLSANVGVDLGFNLGFGYDLKPSAGGGGQQAPAPANPLTTTAGFSGGFKASIGQNWYYTESKSKSTKGGTDSTLSSSFKVNFETYNFAINAKTKRCLFVKTNDEIIENLGKSGISMPLGLYHCESQIIERQYKENFYLVRQECVAGSPVADCSLDQENGLTMMIRGKNAFNMFVSLVQNIDLETSLMPVSSERLKSQIQSWETQLKTMATTQVYPGALVTPVVR